MNTIPKLLCIKYPKTVWYAVKIDRFINPYNIVFFFFF